MNMMGITEDRLLKYIVEVFIALFSSQFQIANSIPLCS